MIVANLQPFDFFNGFCFLGEINMIQKTKTQLSVPLAGLSDTDIEWIERRTSLPLCSMRIAADLRQLADEIDELNRQHDQTISKIRECIGIPRSVSFVK